MTTPAIYMAAARKVDAQRRIPCYLTAGKFHYSDTAFLSDTPADLMWDTVCDAANLAHIDDSDRAGARQHRVMLCLLMAEMLRNPA